MYPPPLSFILLQGDFTYQSLKSHLFLAQVGELGVYSSSLAISNLVLPLEYTGFLGISASIVFDERRRCISRTSLPTCYVFNARSTWSWRQVMLGATVVASRDSNLRLISFDCHRQRNPLAWAFVSRRDRMSRSTWTTSRSHCWANFPPSNWIYMLTRSPACPMYSKNPHSTSMGALRNFR